MVQLSTSIVLAAGALAVAPALAAPLTGAAAEIETREPVRSRRGGQAREPTGASSGLGALAGQWISNRIAPAPAAPAARDFEESELEARTRPRGGRRNSQGPPRQPTGLSDSLGRFIGGAATQVLNNQQPQVAPPVAPVARDFEDVEARHKQSAKSLRRLRRKLRVKVPKTPVSPAPGSAGLASAPATPEPATPVTPAPVTPATPDSAPATPISARDFDDVYLEARGLGSGLKKGVRKLRTLFKGGASSARVPQAPTEAHPIGSFAAGAASGAGSARVPQVPIGANPIGSFAAGAAGGASSARVPQVPTKAHPIGSFAAGAAGGAGSARVPQAPTEAHPVGSFAAGVAAPPAEAPIAARDFDFDQLNTRELEELEDMLARGFDNLDELEVRKFGRILRKAGSIGKSVLRRVGSFAGGAAGGAAPPPAPPAEAPIAARDFDFDQLNTRELEELEDMLARGFDDLDELEARKFGRLLRKAGSIGKSVLSRVGSFAGGAVGGAAPPAPPAEAAPVARYFDEELDAREIEDILYEAREYDELD